MAKKPRVLTTGDNVECRVYLGSTKYDEWYKGIVVGVRETSFDVRFDPPCGPAKVGQGLFHKAHEGDNWRYDKNPPPKPKPVVTEEPSDAS